MKSESHGLKEQEPVSDGFAAGRGLDSSLSEMLKSDTQRELQHCLMIFLNDDELRDFYSGETFLAKVGMLSLCCYCTEMTR